MLYKLDEYWQKEIKKAAKLINPARDKNADIQDFIHIGDDVYIEVENLLGWIENLDYELDHTLDELEETKQDIQDNYIQRTAWEDSGMSYHDFI